MALRVVEQAGLTDVGRQLRTAERLKVADVIRIGDSEYRYQE